MADTTALKNRIRAAIKDNDNQEITGPVLQQALLDMVDELNGATETEASQRQNADNTLQQNITAEKNRAEGAEQTLSQSIFQLQTAVINLRNAGYAFGGIAVPGSNPGVPTSNCFYIAIEPGTYNGFRNVDNEPIVIENEGLYVLTYEAVENNYWEWNLIVGIDVSPTENSHNIPESGGVFAALNSLQTAIRDLRNAGYAFAGTAETDTNPGIPSSNCFYIVRGAGTYTYFKNADDESIVLSADGIYVLTYKSVENQYWEWNLIVGIDFNPAKESSNFLESGGAAETYGYYIEENPEFIYVCTDKNKKILFGINKNGNFYFGAGCPEQVKKYIEKYIEKCIEQLSLDEYEDIVAFIGSLAEGDKTLQQLLNEKLDVEGLDHDALSEIKSFSDNPEYLHAIIDKSKKIIEAIRREGIKEINIPIVTPSVKIMGVNNPEWAYLIIDKNKRILGGFRKDGSFEYFVGVPTPIKEFVNKLIPNQFIVCTGDSVTEGSHLPEAGTALYDGYSYPAQLLTMLKDQGYDRYDVINQGNGGEELQDMVARTCGMMNFLTQNITLSNDNDHWNDWVDIGSYWARNTDNRKIAIPFKDLNGNDYKVCFTHAYGDTPIVYIDGNYYNFRTRGSSVTGEEGLTYDEIQKISRDNKTTLIPAGTSIITGTTKAPYISTIMGGHNRADYLNFEKWAEMSEACFKTGSKGLVIGYHKPVWNVWADLAGNNNTDEGRAERYADYHRKAVEKFGVNFLDLWDEFYRHAMDYCLAAGYFSALSSARIAEMRADLANHILPIEFSYDHAHQGDVHLSVEGYYVIAKLIFNKLVALKYIIK